MKIETDSSLKSERKVRDIIVSTVVNYLRPTKIILFGSRVKDKGVKYSDYDIAVLGADFNIRQERKLKEELDERLGILTVDIINLDKVDSEFRKLIESHGIVLYEA
jgi:predicted nucleotidyltransferase